MAQVSDPPNSGDVRISSPPERLRVLLEQMTDKKESRGAPFGQVLALAVGTPDPNSKAEWCRAFMVVWGLVEEAESYVKARLENYEDTPHRRTFHEIRSALQRVDLSTQYSPVADALANLINMLFRS